MNRIAFRLIRRFKRWFPVRSLQCIKSVLLMKRLEQQPQPVFPDGYEFTVADQGDLDAIYSHTEALSRSVYSRRIENGDICFCLKLNSEIASYHWVRFTSCCVLCGRKAGFEFISLGRNQVFTYDFYTYRQHRGLGVGTCLRSAILHELESRNVQEIYTVVNPRNLTSLRINLRYGYKPVGLIYCIGIFKWTKVFYGSKKEEESMQRWISEFSYGPDFD